MDSTKKTGGVPLITSGADPSPQHVVSQSSVQSILLRFGMAGCGGRIFFVDVPVFVDAVVAQMWIAGQVM
jgi:hypothetical protein